MSQSNVVEVEHIVEDLPRSSMVKIHRGIYGSNLIENELFECVDENLREGRNGLYIKVLNKDNDKYPKKILKITVHAGDYEIIQKNQVRAVLAANKPKELTDKQILGNIREKFRLMEQLALNCANGVVKGLVISGAPGTGKSYNVQRVLEENGFENIVVDKDGSDVLSGFSETNDLDIEYLEGKKYYILCKGRVTPLSLYMLLYQHKNATIVFDDCDSVLMDGTSLNILKAALDSYSRRIISWNTRAVGMNVPRKFEFTGRVIFISNLYLDKFKEGSQLRLHLDAIMSRCHFLDLCMDSNKEKILRIAQSIEDGLLDELELTDRQKKQIVDFITKNQEDFREISLRTAIKIAETMKMVPDDWQKMAFLTCLGGRSKAIIE